MHTTQEKQQINALAKADPTQLQCADPLINAILEYHEQRMVDGALLEDVVDEINKVTQQTLNNLMDADPIDNHD
jgi:hypothetical protein